MPTKFEAIIKNYAHDYRGIAMDRDDLEKILISFGNEYARQAVKEVIEEIEKGLPVVEGIIGSTEEVKFGFSACLARINEFINKLKAKYD